MKHRFIVVILLITALLSGCGNTQVTEVTTQAEKQESPQETVELTVDPEWWNGKQFYCEDNKMVFWGIYESGVIQFYMNYNFDISTNTRVAVVRAEDYILDQTSLIEYDYQDELSTMTINYSMEKKAIMLFDVETATRQPTGLTGMYGLYAEVTPPKNEQPETHETLQEQQPDDFYTDGDYTIYGRYQCFETDTFVGVETQNGSLVLYFEPEAETFVLDRNGADTGWEFINWEFEDRVYTSVTIQDNEMIISSTEPWRFDGTYIQLPDIDTDEGE